MAFHGKLVVQGSPCTACVIINNLNKETLERVVKKRDDFTFEIITIGNPSEIVTVVGVEVERMPIVLINDEQITAGSILAPKQLCAILDGM